MRIQHNDKIERIGAEAVSPRESTELVESFENIEKGEIESAENSKYMIPSESSLILVEKRAIDESENGSMSKSSTELEKSS